MAEQLLYDVGGTLNRSKRISYQEQIIRMFTTYIVFLQDHGLTTRTIIAPGTLPDRNTKIMSSDLTEEGLAFVVRAEQKWFRAVDRGGSPERTSILERELAALRSGKGQAGS